MTPSRALVAVALFTLASLCAFRSTIFGDGVPSFHHDWSWSDIRPEQSAPMRFLLSVWNANAFGSPNVRVVNHPALWLQHALSGVADPKVLLMLAIAGSTLFFALGTLRLLRAFDVPPGIAIVGSIVAAFGPATFTKFVAGHWYYLVAAAALPWAIESARNVERPGIWAGALRTGAIVALTSLQPQIWVFTQILAIALAAIARGSWSKRAIAVAIVAAAGCVLSLPALAGAFGAHSAQPLAGAQTIPFWERNNSSPLTAAPVALGYFTGYAERAFDAAGIFGRSAALLWLVPAGALAGAIAGRRLHGVGAIAVAWLVALGLVAGVNGPLAAVLETLFARYLWASAFRELYHFAMPMWLCACALAAIGASALNVRWRLAVAALPAIAIVALWFAPDYGGQLRSFVTPPPVRSALQAIANAPGEARFALLPAIDPVGPGDSQDDEGLDPNAHPLGDHPAANAIPEGGGTLATALMLAQQHDRRATAWLDAGDVGYVVDQPGLRSRPYSLVAAAPELRDRLRALMPPSPVAPLAVTTIPTSVAYAATGIDVAGDPLARDFRGGFLQARDAGVASWQSLRVPSIDPQQTDPLDGWVLARYAYWLDPYAALWPDAALTASDLPLPVPPEFRGGWAWIVGSANAVLVDDRLRAIPVRRAVWIPLSARAGTLAFPRGFGIVLGFARTLPASPRIAPPATRWNVPFSYACLCARGALPPRARWIVLKQSFDDGWRLEVVGGRVLRHVRYSSYGNAWEVAAGAPSARYAVWYEPARWWQPLVDDSAIAWLCIAIAACATGIYARRAGASMVVPVHGAEPGASKTSLQ